MISVLIPFKNDFKEIGGVVKNILDTAQSDDLEILVYNDGSVYPSRKPRLLELDLPHTRVINGNVSFGVGYAFDRMAEQANGDILVITASDVFPKEGWHNRVTEAVQSNHNTIGCAVCVGNEPPYRKHYGADLLFTVSNEDLPKNSKLRERKGGYTNLFKGKWRDVDKCNAATKIQCLMGAFYFTSKEYYNIVGGWDTKAGQRYQGHYLWGHLEPHISLKSWLIGGGCTLYPDIEATHVFGRAKEENKWNKGLRSEEHMWWNALWILETCILSEYERNRLYDFVNPELNFNEAKKMIRRHYDNIEVQRDINRLKFKNDLSVFKEINLIKK